MQSEAATVDQYLADLPDVRRRSLQAVRDVILRNLPTGYVEGMQYGMIGYAVPHSIYPPGYHCDPRQPLPFAGLAAQKNHLSLYLMCIYMKPEHEIWFRSAWAKSGKRLDMGRSCIRFRSHEDVPLDVIGEAVRRVPVDELIAQYEAVLRPREKAKAARTAKSMPPAKPSPQAAVKAPVPAAPAKVVAPVAKPIPRAVVSPAKKGAKPAKKTVAKVAKKSAAKPDKKSTAKLAKKAARRK